MTTDAFDLNLRHLRALSAMVELGSMSAAADHVGLSQPALTQGLAKLESQVGTVLFDRRATGVVPTSEGAVLAARAAAAFDALETPGRRAARQGRGIAPPGHLISAAQARAFLALSSAGSFAAAATGMGVSQPAIHRAARDLEQIWGRSLIERRGRSIAFTAAGMRVARAIRLAQKEIDAALATIAGDKGAERIAIGAMPLSRALVLPKALARFAAIAPNALVDVYEGSWRDLIEPLLDGIIDLTIGALRDEAAPGSRQEPLFEDRLSVIGRAGHPLVRVSRPTLDDLSRYGWIVGQAGTPLRAHWQALFSGHPLPPIPIECGSVMVIRGVLAETDLLTLLSPHQVALEVEAGMLAQIAGELPGARRIIGLTTRTGWRPTAAQAQMIELIRDVAKQT